MEGRNITPPLPVFTETPMTREITARLMALIANEDGQDLLEYSMLAALIALGAVGALRSVGDTLNSLWWEPISGAFGGL